MSGPTFRGWIRKYGTGPTLTVTPADLSAVGAAVDDSVMGFGWVRTVMPSSAYGTFAGLVDAYGGHSWRYDENIYYVSARLHDTVEATDLQDGYAWTLPDDTIAAVLDLCIVKRISEANSPWVYWYGSTYGQLYHFFGSAHHHTYSDTRPNPENTIFWGLSSIIIMNPTGTWTVDAHVLPPQTQTVFTSYTPSWVNFDGLSSVMTAAIIVEQPLDPEYLPYTIFSSEYQSSADVGALANYAMGYQTYTPAPPPPSGGMPSLKLRKVAGGELPYFLHSKMLNGEDQQTST